MTYPRRLRVGAILALGVLGAVVFAVAASAGQPFRETIHDERTFVLDDFCGVAGLDVEVNSIIDARVQVGSRGRDQLSYFLQHGTTTETLTNPATGTSLRSVTRVLEKDLRVTDNGDGTLTILLFATGNATLYGTDGKAIARNPGQFRFRLLVDDGGTPSDPSDDEIIDFLGVVKQSTGRSD